MMAQDNTKLIELAAKVIDPPSSGENEIEAAIRELVRAMGFRANSQSVNGGRTDIYLPDNNLVIETKDRGKVSPEGPGSLSGETQREQLERYVLALHDSQRGQLQFTDNRYWRGILTDGLDWCLYGWLENDRGDLYTLWSERERPPISDSRFLADWLKDFIGNTPEKHELPENLSSVFGGSLESLRVIYDELSNEQATVTKFELWKDMMRGSGFDVAGSEAELFVVHTFLVTVAEAVIASLSENDLEPCEVMGDGFASWPQRRGRHGPTYHIGAAWVRRVFENANLYNWRSRERDVLRVLYQDIIDRQHRKSFGEFYTPDWLAQLVVDEVIDDNWIERAINTTLGATRPKIGIGVLDPACGSGTFLFHAARKILDSDPLKRQRMSRSEAGRVVAQLVFGIDIHPVAVSIARATLMRALPPGSVDSPEELNVWQGDSLMLRRGMAMASQDASAIIEVLTPQQTPINVPLAFAESPRFASELRRVVATAHAGEPLPFGVGHDLDAQDFQRLRAMHATLTDVCRDEGNSVWSWYLTNYLAPYMLARRGVDRIVANPPWVRMSNIQVVERKRDLENLIGELGLNAGRQLAGNFDIAGLFVSRCRQRFFRGTDVAAGWVLNWAATKAGNWKRVREDQLAFNFEFLDLSRVRESPFTGAKACVWIQRGSSNQDPRIRSLVNKDRFRIGQSDGRQELKRKTVVINPRKPYAEVPSDYARSENRSFATGASLRPHVLVKVANVKNGHVTTAKSIQPPWNSVSPQNGEIPDHYLHATAFPEDLLVFGYVEKSYSIAALTHEGEPDFHTDDNGGLDFLHSRSHFWNMLNELYERHRGKGLATPKTLWERINLRNSLLNQLDPDERYPFKIAYNKAGQTLRAARLPRDLIVEDSIYYMPTRPDEAAFLASMFNAPCLQLAYRDSRESDRHFDLHPIRKVPIPKFVSDNSDHRELVELCELSEIAAQEIIDGLPANVGQIKASNGIRKKLLQEGLANAIDDVVRRVLPSHSVTQYTEQFPHPWA